VGYEYLNLCRLWDRFSFSCASPTAMEDIQNNESPKWEKNTDLESACPCCVYIELRLSITLAARNEDVSITGRHFFFHELLEDLRGT
jgi:hypothetical protein